MPSPILSSPALLQILADPAYHPYLAVLKGVRNGIVYGTKVRFPHAVVMTFLWGHGDWKSRIRRILNLTRQHAMGLATFVSLYKMLLLLQRRMNGNKPRTLDSFFAGLFGGYVVFGDRTSVNEQIVLYISSRVLLSFLPRASPYNNNNNSSSSSTLPLNITPSDWESKKPIPPNPTWFRMLASIAWAMAMYRFTHHSETLQPGMFNSMRYLYAESEWWDSLKTLLWHNK